MSVLLFAKHFMKTLLLSLLIFSLSFLTYSQTLNYFDGAKVKKQSDKENEFKKALASKDLTRQLIGLTQFVDADGFYDLDFKSALLLFKTKIDAHEVVSYDKAFAVRFRHDPLMPFREDVPEPPVLWTAVILFDQTGIFTRCILVSGAEDLVLLQQLVSTKNEPTSQPIELNVPT